MGEPLPADLTQVINRMDRQDRGAISALLPAVYADLRRLADSFFSRERQDHTLQPTALVHEAYVHLMNRAGGQYESRIHFFRAAAVTMRHILLQHARDRKRLKRGGDAQRIPLTDDVAAIEEGDIDFIALDEALIRLGELDSRQAQLVELRFFAGLTVAETAELLGVSRRTAEEEWTLAKAWLWREMNP